MESGELFTGLCLLEKILNTIYIDEKRYSPIDTLQQAVDKLGTEGGTIHIREGLHYSGPLVLKSAVHLHIENNAELRFIDDFSLYPAVFTRWEGIECYAVQSLIFAEDSSDIIISGEGIINGMGRKWWAAFRSIREGRYLPEVEDVRDLLSPLNKESAGGSGGGGRETDFLRPSLIQFKNCKDISISGITVQNSPFWNTHILYSDSVTLKNVKFKNPANAPNTDGLDIDSSRNVLVEDCQFDVGDDCLCLKSGMDENGIKIDRETSDIIVRNCSMNNGHGGVVIGSETSGGIHDVTISDCRMTGTDRGIRIKTRRGRGGTIENITIKDIKMDNVCTPIVINMYYRCGADQREIPRLKNPCFQAFDIKTTPVIRNISIQNINASGICSSSGFFLGLPESPIKALKIKNYSARSCRGSTTKDPAMDLFYTKAEGPEILYRNLTGCDFEEVWINSKSENISKKLKLLEERKC